MAVFNTNCFHDIAVLWRGRKAAVELARLPILARRPATVTAANVTGLRDPEGPRSTVHSRAVSHPVHVIPISSVARATLTLRGIIQHEGPGNLVPHRHQSPLVLKRDVQAECQLSIRGCGPLCNFSLRRTIKSDAAMRRSLSPRLRPSLLNRRGDTASGRFKNRLRKPTTSGVAPDGCALPLHRCSAWFQSPISSGKTLRMLIGYGPAVS
jgi:hypothetical protein